MSPADILAFEARHPRHVTLKDQKIRGDLGLTPVRYYALLIRAASSDEGIRADPVTARIVRERAALRASQRALRVQALTA